MLCIRCMIVRVKNVIDAGLLSKWKQYHQGKPFIALFVKHSLQNLVECGEIFFEKLNFVILLKKIKLIVSIFVLM